MVTQKQSAEQQYLDILKQIISSKEYEARTNENRIRLFGAGHQIRFCPAVDFPLLTVRKMSEFWKYEFCAFCVDFSENIETLGSYAPIWKPWADEEGNLGKLYATEMKNNLHDMIESIWQNPYASTHVMTTWNTDNFSSAKIRPCHGTVIQFLAHNKNGVDVLNMSTYQRSADFGVGVPHNLCYYSLLHILVAKYLHMECGELCYTFGDAHIYANQQDQVREMLSREPLMPIPSVRFDETTHRMNIETGRWDYTEVNVLNIEPKDITVCNYRSYPAIKFPRAAV